MAAIERLLAERGIPLMARDCGGDRGRRVSFDIASTEMTIETLGLPPTIL